MTVSVHGLPFVLGIGSEVRPVPPALKGPRVLRVVSCEDGPTGQLVGFDGVDSLGAADALVGKTLLVREADLPDSFELHDVVRLVGREVTDVTRGPLGVIDEVLQGVAQDVWVVRGAAGEVLVPVVEPLVVSIEGDGPIIVDVPHGLVEGE